MAFRTLEEFFAAIDKPLTTPHKERQYVYAYWSELDSIAHATGISSKETAQHLRAWDNAFARFLERIAGTDTLVIVTADHGFIDTDAGHTVELSEHPKMADCLALPLCGEPRAAYAYLRPRQTERFEDYVYTHLSHAVDLFRSETLIEQGWFGQGVPHPRLASRIGDYTLLMKQNYIIRDALPGEHRHQLKGVHGGTSPAEMWIPLVVTSA
jgi:predicted AlkP superfamily pyrophosphatase or phosphodiesterase